MWLREVLLGSVHIYQHLQYELLNLNVVKANVMSQKY